MPSGCGTGPAGRKAQRARKAAGRARPAGGALKTAAAVAPAAEPIGVTRAAGVFSCSTGPVVLPGPGRAALGAAARHGPARGQADPGPSGPAARPRATLAGRSGSRGVGRTPGRLRCRTTRSRIPAGPRPAQPGVRQPARLAAGGAVVSPQLPGLPRDRPAPGSRSVPEVGAFPRPAPFPVDEAFRRPRLVRMRARADARTRSGSRPPEPGHHRAGAGSRVAAAPGPLRVSVAEPESESIRVPEGTRTEGSRVSSRSRSRLGIRLLNSFVLLTDTHAWAYYRIPSVSYEFATRRSGRRWPPTSPRRWPRSGCRTPRFTSLSRTGRIPPTPGPRTSRGKEISAWVRLGPQRGVRAQLSGGLLSPSSPPGWSTASPGNACRSSTAGTG